MFIHVSPTLDVPTFFKALFLPEEYRLENARLFSYVRGAMITAIHSLRADKKTGKVWLPAFVCDTVIYLLEEYKIEHVLYHIKEDLTPDWEAIDAQRPGPGDIFMLVHYFGFPMAPKETLEYCEKNKLELIEDCAHSIVRQIRPGGMGTYGKAALFGLRKILPIPHGGILFMKDAPVILPDRAPAGRSIYRNVPKMMAQNIMQRLGTAWKAKMPRVDKTRLETMPANYYAFNYLEKMGFWAGRIAAEINIDAVIEKRRRNFQAVYCALRGVRTIKIPETLTLKDRQAVPWVFFFYHDKAEDLINRLIDHGISAAYFPTLHRRIFNHPEWRLENDLFRRAVTLPVHQDITPKQLDYMIETVKKYA